MAVVNYRKAFARFARTLLLVLLVVQGCAENDRPIDESTDCKQLLLFIILADQGDLSIQGSNLHYSPGLV